MKKQTAGKELLGDIAPKFAQLNDDVLFGEVWSRVDKLSLRDRSLITVTALITKGIFDNSLSYHIKNAKNNGVTFIEMIEIITQLAFYVGWPNAWAAFPLVRKVYTEDIEDNFNSLFGIGSYNEAYAKYFIGKSYLNVLNKDGLFIANVTFEPSCRNNWHIHRAKSGGGQILLCTNGYGWYQEEGKEARRLSPGDVVYIAPNIKHWHGANKNNYFSHIAIEIPGEDCSTEWLECVDEKEYNKINEDYN